MSGGQTTDDCGAAVVRWLWTVMSNEEGVGEQHEGEMTIPAEVAAHFIVVKAEGFGRFQVLFDAPARADGQPPWWAQGSRVAPRPGSRPTRVGRPGSGAPRANGDRRRPQHARWADEPVKEALAFGTQALGETLPIPRAEGLLGDASHIREQEACPCLHTDHLNGRDGEAA